MYLNRKNITLYRGDRLSRQIEVDENLVNYLVVSSQDPPQFPKEQAEEK